MIKRSFFVMALATSAVLSNGAYAKLLNPLSEGLHKTKANAVRDVYSGIKFSYFDREDRLLILNDFFNTVELEYALLPLKKERIGLDFEKLKITALEIEKNIEDITLEKADRKNEDLVRKKTFLQASSNMDFLDRMQALIANFKDTHFSFQEKISRPYIYNGLRFVRIQNKIIVGSRENKFLSMAGKLSQTDFSTIQIGDEVISIDGIPVEEKIDEMKQYVSGSSDEFVDSQAVRMLTLRNARYDKKNYSIIEFRNAGVFKIPIFVNNAPNSTPRLDAITYFNKYNIPSDSTNIGMTFDKGSNTWTDSGLAYEGYSTRKLHLNLKGMTEFLDDQGSPGLRTGFYINKGKTYGVLQILTFFTRNLKTGNTTLPFLDAIRNFIIEMKENELPLILDLRVNGGGNGNFPAGVLSLLAEEGVVYPGATSGFRMTYYMRQLQEPGLFQEIVGENQTFGLTIDQLKNIITDTIENRENYTPMFTTEIIPYDSKVGGFHNKIVALVTADCISACDKMAFLLKASKRATIIGTHSNGTGAGFLSSGELNTQWEDKLRVLSTQVPNYLFGIPGQSFDKVVFEKDSVSTMSTENRPTVADILYSPTILDVARNNLGWLQKAAEVLEEMKEK